MAYQEVLGKLILEDEIITNYNKQLYVFEGLDNVGKTTIINAVMKRLKERFGEDNVVYVAFPDKTSVLSQEAFLTSDSIEGYLLMLASNIKHYKEHVSRLLYEGYVVVCDRWFISNLLYQPIMMYLKENPKHTDTVNREIQHLISLGLEALQYANIPLPRATFLVNASKERRKDFMACSGDKVMIEHDHVSLKYHDLFVNTLKYLTEHGITSRYLAIIENEGSIEMETAKAVGIVDYLVSTSLRDPLSKSNE